MSTPASATIILNHGTTPRLRMRLTSRNVRTGALVARPKAGDVFSWMIAWPGQSETLTSAANGGLAIDPVTRVITFPCTIEKINGIKSGTEIPFTVTVTNTDGAANRFVEGVIRVEGNP